MKTLHGITVALILTASLQAHAALPTDALIAAGSYVEVHVEGSTNMTDLAISGTLAKRGSGELVLTNALSLPGTVHVREGTVTFTDTDARSLLPAGLQRGLALWVDASTNVVLDGAGRVDKWLDVREPSTDAPYSYMRAEHDYAYYSEGPRSRKPARVQGNAHVNNLPMVDFGTFGATNAAAAWLPWRNADNTRGVLTGIRAFFVVAAFPDSNGFTLGDWDYTAAGGEANIAGARDFWLGTEVNPKKYFRLFHTTVSKVYQQTTFINGIHVDGVMRVPDALGHVMGTVSSVPLTAGNFFNGCNQDGYSGTFPHIGGGSLGEVLVYTNALTEAERLAVDDYLIRKWKREDRGGAVQIAKGGTAVSDVPQGRTNRLTAVSGEGVWRKTGAGAVTLARDFNTMSGPIRLEEGALVDNGFVRRPNRVFEVPEHGFMVDAAMGRWEALATETPGALVKNGAGELTITGLPPAVTQVAVNEGTLRLTRALRAPFRIEPVEIFNASFEIFDNHDFHGQWSAASPELWGFEPAGSGWTYTGNPTAGSSPHGAGIYMPDGHTTVWSTIRQPAPDGVWVALIKQGGGMGTTFDAPDAGRYRLVFYVASRGGSYARHLLNILVDGQEVAHMRTRRTLFERKEVVLPWLEAGAHTLFFQGVNEGADRASLLDDVRVERIDAAEVEAAVTNGGFEVSAALTDNDANNTNDPGSYSYTYTVTGTGWDFSRSDNGNDNSGITEEYSPFMSQRLAAEGTRCAFLRQQGTMSTVVTFPTNGTYELSFLSAARFDWIKWPAQTYNLHDYRIKLDDAQVATVTTHKKVFERVTVRLPAVTNAPVVKELRFEGINSLSGDRTSLIDDVRIVRLPDSDPVQDGGFEVPPGALANGGDNWQSGMSSTAWTFDLGTGQRSMSGIARNGGAWPLPTAPEGTCAAFLQMAAQMSQTVVFPEDGYYTLTFMATGRMRPLPTYCLHDFKILFGGEEIGFVQTFDETWRRYSFRLPYVKAGEAYTLRLQGINSIANQFGTSEDHTSFIDDVQIVRQDLADRNDGPPDGKDITVRLGTGARLALDFPGQIVLNELWHEGRLYTGTLDASNAPFLTGAGSVYVAPKGTMLFLK